MSEEALPIGTVLAIPTRRGVVMAQLTHRLSPDDFERREVLWLLDSFFTSIPGRLDSLMHLPARFPVTAEVSASVADGSFLAVGRAEVPERWRRCPTFRFGIPWNGGSDRWWTWNAKERRVVDALTPELATLPVDWPVWGDTLKVYLESGWTPERDPLTVRCLRAAGFDWPEPVDMREPFAHYFPRAHRASAGGRSLRCAQV